MQKTNSERLQEIAEGMHELNERLVYVGVAFPGSLPINIGKRRREIKNKK